MPSINQSITKNSLTSMFDFGTLGLNSWDREEPITHCYHMLVSVSTSFLITDATVANALTVNLSYLISLCSPGEIYREKSDISNPVPRLCFQTFPGLYESW